MGKAVFYSFHYDRDVSRVMLVRNINALEGQPLLNAQQWETVRRQGRQGIENWIHKEMNYKKAVIVLIGKETASRPWVKYEIEKAWASRKPLLGIRIHGISAMGDVDTEGPSPFDPAFKIPVFDPTRTNSYGKIDSTATYNYLRQHLSGWSDRGVVRRDA